MTGDDKVLLLGCYQIILLLKEVRTRRLYVYNFHTDTYVEQLRTAMYYLVMTGNLAWKEANLSVSGELKTNHMSI